MKGESTTATPAVNEPRICGVNVEEAPSGRRAVAAPPTLNVLPMVALLLTAKPVPEAENVEAPVKVLADVPD